MIDLMELYELDLELSCRLMEPTMIGDALKEQGLVTETIEQILFFCRQGQFRNATDLALQNNCDFQRANQYLEKQALARKYSLTTAG